LCRSGWPVTSTRSAAPTAGTARGAPVPRAPRRATAARAGARCAPPRGGAGRRGPTATPRGGTAWEASGRRRSTSSPTLRTATRASVWVMPLDQSFVGRVYAPTAPYEVGREKIREFADAIGDTNPAYRDPDAAKALGHPDVIAPPTFPVIVTSRAAHQVIMAHEIGVGYTRVG